MRFTKQFLLIALLLVSLTSFGQKTITWYRLTNDTSVLNYNPFTTTYTIKTGYYNINPKTGEQFRYTGGTTWIKDSLFKSSITILDTTINNITNITNTINSIGGIRWVTDWPQFIAALTDPSVRSINLAANLTAASKAYIPTNQSTIKEIEGHGFEITIPSTIDTGFIRTYPTLTAANSGIDQQLRVRNLVMRGAGNNIGIYLSSNYGAKFEGCRFYNFSTAMDLRWCMATLIDQCFFWENITGINLDYDRFAGGSNSTSQSNHSVVQNCKFRSKAGGNANIRVWGASGIQILHNIFEGPNGNYDVLFDDNGSTVVKEVYMYGNHVEHQPIIAAFYIKLKDGYAYCGGIYSQLDCTLITFESSAYAKCVVEGIPHLTSGTKFQSIGSGARWWFINMPVAFDPNTVTYWLGGTAPTNSRLDNWNSNGQSPFLQLGTRRP